MAFACLTTPIHTKKPARDVWTKCDGGVSFRGRIYRQHRSQRVVRSIPRQPDISTLSLLDVTGACLVTGTRFRYLRDTINHKYQHLLY